MLWMSEPINQVEFYVDEKGNSPFDEWLDGLVNEKALAAVLSSPSACDSY